MQICKRAAAAAALPQNQLAFISYLCVFSPNDMDRIEFSNSAEHRKDAALAAFFCNQTSQQDISVVQQASEQHVLTEVHIAGLEGGAWAARYARRATVTAFGRTIVIAFHGAHGDEGLFNFCFLGKGQPRIA